MKLAAGAWRPVLVLAAALALGCAQVMVIREGVPVPLAKAVEKDLAAAQAELEAGKHDAARVRLERLLQETPDAPRADEARYLLGLAWRDSGKPDRALATWRLLLERHPRSPRAPDARLGMAALYREQGRPELAREVLQGTEFDRASDAQRAALYRALADLARSFEDYGDALRWLALAEREREDPAAREEIELEMNDLLEGRLSDAELERLAPELPRGPAYDRVQLERARRALERGDAAAALAALESLPRRLREQDEARREALLAQAQRGAVQERGLLGVALPLSGAYGPYGRSALRGVALGLGLYDEEPAPYRLLVRDTRGDPDVAERVVSELAEAGVVAVIGPLRSATALRAAPIAQQLRLPLLTLAQRDDLPFLGDYVFRLGLAPADQVRALVDHAFREGQRRFAILHPDDELGQHFKTLFQQAVELRGGEIVGVEAYTRAAVDHQVPIKKLVGLYNLSERERALVAERDRLARRPVENRARLASPEFAKLPPFINFDALFIPDDARAVGLVLPQLRYYDVRDVALLGSSGWNDPALVKIAGREAAGAVFADAFFARSALPFVQEFVARYYAAYGDEPDAIAAQSYDAATVLRRLMDDRAVTRESLRHALLGLRDFPGVSGVTSFDEAGGTRKSLYLLTVRGERIEELEAAR